MTDVSGLSLMPLLPELFVAVAALLLLVVGVFKGNKATTGLCAAAGVVFVIAAGLLIHAGGDEITALNGFFIMDNFALFMKLLVLGGMVAVTALSVRYINNEQMGRFEYPILLMFVTLGMLLMISASSLLSLYMALELQSLSIYVLAAFRRDDGRSSEAGLKYFILGSLSSGMLLFGISLIYGYTGAIGYGQIAAALTTNPVADTGLVVGLVFALVGIAFKVSAVPFHMWTPDVYEGAPTSVTAMMALVPKVAALALMTRLLFGPFMTMLPQWQQIVWVLSAASMAWGAFAAIGQNNIKRLMAYSSINNMGYALIGIVSGTADSVGAMMVYMAIYMVMTAGVFGIILAMRRKGAALENISDLAGLSRNDPLLGYAMAFFMFSMSGIPPLAGFFGKLVVFQTAISSGLPVLAVIGVLASVVAAYYYLRVIKVMFFDEAAGPFDRDLGYGMKAVIGLSTIAVLLFIFAPDTLVAAGRSAAAVFFAG